MAGEGTVTNPLINQARLLALLAGAALSVGNLTVTGNFSQSGAGTFATGTGTVSLNGSTTIPTGKTLTVTDLTSGRCIYSTTAGLLTSSANLTFNGTDFAHAGSGTFGTGTGAVSLNGTTTVSGTAARPFIVNSSNSSANIGLRSTATANAANSSTIEFYAKDGGAADQLYGYIQVVSSTLTAGAETSTMNIGTIDAGAFSNTIQLVGKNATVAGVWSLINSTASTTTGNGALVVTGGVGVGGAINSTSITCGTSSLSTGAVNVNTGLGFFDATSNLLGVQANSVLVAYFTPTRLQLQQPLRLANAYVATPQTPTGYVTLQDSTGTTYKIPCNV